MRGRKCGDRLRVREVEKDKRGWKERGSQVEVAVKGCKVGATRASAKLQVREQGKVIAGS